MVGSPAPASQLCLSLHRPSRRNLGEAPRTPFKFQGKETRGLDSESSVKYLRFAHGRTALREARVRGGNSRDEDGGSCPSDGDREGGGGGSRDNEARTRALGTGCNSLCLAGLVVERPKKPDTLLTSPRRRCCGPRNGTAQYTSADPFGQGAPWNAAWPCM